MHQERIKDRFQIYVFSGKVVYDRHSFLDSAPYLDCRTDPKYLFPEILFEIPDSFGSLCITFVTFFYERIES